MNNTTTQGTQGGRIRWALPQTADSATGANLLGVLWGLASWRAVEGEGEWRVLAWRYIARQAQVSRAYVARELRRWERAGLIEAQRRHAHNGAQLPNAYRFTRERLDAWFKRHNAPNPLTTPPPQGERSQGSAPPPQGERSAPPPQSARTHPAITRPAPAPAEPAPAWRATPHTGREELGPLATAMCKRLEVELARFGAEGRSLAHELSWRYEAAIDTRDLTQWKPYLAFYHGRLRRLYEGAGLPYDPERFKA